MVYGRFLFCLIDSTASADARWTAETKEYLRESRVGLTPPHPPTDARTFWFSAHDTRPLPVHAVYLPRQEKRLGVEKPFFFAQKTVVAQLFVLFSF